MPHTIDWDKTTHMIHSWLRTRHAVMVLLAELSARQPFNNQQACQDLVRDFCQQLIDYVSWGQFGIFEVIAAANAQFPERQCAFNQKVMTELLKTTMEALDFAENYGSGVTGPAFTYALNQLAEDLATRLDIEDRLFCIYKECAFLLQNRVSVIPH